MGYYVAYNSCTGRMAYNRCNAYITVIISEPISCLHSLHTVQYTRTACITYYTKLRYSEATHTEISDHMAHISTLHHCVHYIVAFITHTTYITCHYNSLHIATNYLISCLAAIGALQVPHMHAHSHAGQCSYFVECQGCIYIYIYI